MTAILEEDDLQSIEILKQFNLNEYEAKTYVVLLRIGDAAASDIADAADVPQPRVYDVLRSLGQKGLVTKQPTSPKQYSPNHARRSVEHLLYRVEKNYEERISHLRNQKDELLDILPDRSDIDKDPKKIRTVEGTYAVACKLIEGMQDVEETFKIVGESPFVRLKSRSSFDNQIGDRPVEIRALGLFDEDELAEMDRNDAVVKGSDEFAQSFFLFDDERLLQIYEAENSLGGLYTAEPQLVRTYLDRFERLWVEE
jgi:sugar-specific transcriptional regulator TrmB